MLKSLALSLGLTLILELGAAVLLGIRSRRDLLAVGLINVVTNPLVVLVFNLFFYFGHTAPWYWVAGLELAAVLAEGFLFSLCLSYKRIHPFLLSLILNGISYFGGLLLS